MSGILGIWHRDGRPVDRFEIERLTATLRHRGADDEGVRVDGAAGLACCLARIAPESVHETQPVADTDGSMLVFDGRLDNRDELLTALESDATLSKESPDSTLALAAYRAFGDECPARLNGDFALGVFDSRRRRILLARDAIGVRPLYYYVDRDLFLFASEIKALLAHRRVESRPDDDVLADFIFTQFTGQEPQERTFFHNIVSVLPSHSVVVTCDGLRTRQYWDFDLGRQLRFRNVGDYADAFKAQFEQAVGRRLRSAAPVAVSVSGGLDSSAIFCMAETLRRRQPNGHPALVGASQVFPDGSPADEKRFLVEIERSYGVTIERVKDLRGGMMDDCEDAIWHGEAPFLDAQGNRTRGFLETIRQRGARVLLTGHWGDQFLFDDAYLIDLCQRGAWREAWTHVNEYGRWVDIPPRHFKRRLCAALVKRHAAPTLVSALRRVRRRFRPTAAPRPWYTDAFRRRATSDNAPKADGHPDATAHARSLYREARSRYHVFGMEWNNKAAAMHRLDMAFPFLDRDLIAFLMAIPGDVQSRKGVYKGILREGLRGVLPEPIAARVAKADFTRLINEGVAEDYNRLTERFGAGALVTEWGYVHAERLKSLAGRALEVRESTCEPSWALRDLLSLEIWIQKFFGPPGSPIGVEGS